MSTPELTQTSARLPALDKPIQVGKYTLLARLAVGGMGEVYVAQMSAVAGFEKQVVIKRLLPHLAQDQHFVTMFLDEARITARLNHPNICQVFELFELEGEYYLAMEYLEGVPISTIIHKYSAKGVDLRVVAGMVMQACHGLGFAHDFCDPSLGVDGVIHRDVSPNNLFATTAGLVKVLDFGIAKLYREGSQTVTGSAKGKYTYMSPEQVRCDLLDRRSDIFSLGIVLFEAATGRRLFRRNSELATMQAIVNGDRLKLKEVRPDVPPALSDVVDAALAINREQRFPSMLAFAEAIAEAMAPLGGAASNMELAAYVREEHGTQVTSQRVRISTLSASSRTPTPSGHSPSPSTHTSSKAATTSSQVGHTPSRRSPSQVPSPVASSGSASARSVAAQASEVEISTKTSSKQRGSTDDLLAALAPPQADEPSGQFKNPIPSYLAPPSFFEAPRRSSGRWALLLVFLLLPAGFVLGWFAGLFTEQPNATTGALASTALVPTGASAGSDADQASATQPGEPTAGQPKQAPSSTSNTGGTAAAGQPGATGQVDEPRDQAKAGQESSETEAASPGEDAESQQRKRATTRRRGSERKSSSNAGSAEPAEVGYFTVDATPYAKIYVGRRKIGVTPLVRIPLPAGQHQIRAVAENGTTKRFSITISADETTTRRLYLAGDGGDAE